MFDEGMVASTQTYGRVGVWPFGRYADAHGVGVCIRFRYYDPEMLNVFPSLRDQEGIATGEQRNAPVF
jgi:hypothetical protein